MSIDIEITQKGLFKKALAHRTIIADLGYGVYENNRLDEGKIGEEFIVYDKNHIGRGISVVCGRNEKNRVVLRLLNPTCNEEIDALYDMIERICSVWTNCVVKQDDEEIKLSDFAEWRSKMKEFNGKSLDSFLEKMETMESLTLFSAMWQLDMGQEERKEILASDEPVKAYGEWLHRLQEMDIYFAMPRFYKTNDGLIGVYFITENTLSAVPLVPAVPFGLTDENGNPVKIDSWRANFYSITADDTIGDMPYSDFIERVKDGAKRYDGSRIIAEPMSDERLRELLKGG
ncbi:MAG: DUF4299 family protein [Oscillospiraceae bacterium]|nr:DUF4299 family protein [Oscillospiraceae bacterium]